MMKIPKRSGKKLLEEIQINSPAYKNDILPEINKGLRALKYQDLKVLSVHVVDNEKLNLKYSTKKQSQQNKNEDVAFLRVTSFEDAQNLCETGLPVSSKLPSGVSTGTLGNPSMGVYLSKYLDFTSSVPISKNEKCFILVCKILKGRVRQFAESDSLFDPTPDFDCHVSKSGMGGHGASLQYYTACFNSSQIFLYEYNSDYEAETYPSNILPIAVFCFVYEPEVLPITNGDFSSTTPVLPVTSALPSVATLMPLKGFQIWKGDFLSTNKTQKFLTPSVLVNFYSRLPPFALPEKMEIKGWLGYSKISEYFTDNLFDGICPAISGLSQIYDGDIFSYVCYVQLMSVEQFTEATSSSMFSPKAGFDTFFKNPLHLEKAAVVQMAKDSSGNQVLLYLFCPSDETTRIGMTNSVYNPPVFHGLVVSTKTIYSHKESSVDTKMLTESKEFPVSQVRAGCVKLEKKAYNKTTTAASNMCFKICEHALSSMNNVAMNQARNQQFFYSDVGAPNFDMDYYGSSELPNVAELIDKISLNANQQPKRVTPSFQHAANVEVASQMRAAEERLKVKMDERMKNKSLPQGPADFSDPCFQLPPQIVSSKPPTIRIKKRKVVDHSDAPPVPDAPEVTRSSIFSKKPRKNYGDAYNRRIEQKSNIDAILPLDDNGPPNRNNTTRRSDFDSEEPDLQMRRPVSSNSNRRESLLDLPLPPPPLSNNLKRTMSTVPNSPRPDLDNRNLSPISDDDNMDVSNSPPPGITEPLRNNIIEVAPRNGNMPPVKQARLESGRVSRFSDKPPSIDERSGNRHPAPPPRLPEADSFSQAPWMDPQHSQYPPTQPYSQYPPNNSSTYMQPPQNYQQSHNYVPNIPTYQSSIGVPLRGPENERTSSEFDEEPEAPTPILDSPIKGRVRPKSPTGGIAVDLGENSTRSRFANDRLSTDRRVRRDSDEEDHPQLGSLSQTSSQTNVPVRENVQVKQEPSSRSMLPPPPPTSRKSDINLQDRVELPDEPYLKPERPHFKVEDFSNVRDKSRAFVVEGSNVPPKIERIEDVDERNNRPRDYRDIDHRRALSNDRYNNSGTSSPHYNDRDPARSRFSDERGPPSRFTDGRPLSNYPNESPRYAEPGRPLSRDSNFNDRSIPSSSRFSNGASNQVNTAPPPPSVRLPATSNAGPTMLKNKLGEWIDITDASQNDSENPYKPPPSYRPEDPAEMCKNLTCSFYRSRLKNNPNRRQWESTGPARFKNMPPFKRSYVPNMNKIKELEAAIQRSEEMAAAKRTVSQPPRQPVPVRRPGGGAGRSSNVDDETEEEIRLLARQRRQDTDVRKDVEHDADFQRLIRAL